MSFALLIFEILFIVSVISWLIGVILMVILGIKEHDLLNTGWLIMIISTAAMQILCIIIKCIGGC